MLKIFFSILFIFTICLSANSQKIENNQKAYSVINLRSSARVASLGMDFLPLFAEDVSVAITNPSIISSKINNQIGLGFTELFAGVVHANAAYSHTFNKVGSFTVGLNYVNYGTFKRTELNGDLYDDADPNRTFSASDYMFTIGWGRMLDSNFYIGANLKPMISQYDNYSSSALAFDVAATYLSTDRLFAATLMARNFGTQLKKYSNEEEDLPFELQLGLSKKLSHAPITLFAMITDIQKWDLRDDDPLDPKDKYDPLKEEIKKENKFLGVLDNTFRHLQFGLNFQPIKSLYISLGYSWKQSREMRLNDAFSLAGFSYGFGINIKRFQVGFARNEYHRYGSPNHLSLVVKL